MRQLIDMTEDEFIVSPLIKRLLWKHGCSCSDKFMAAERIEKLEKALKPFADGVDYYSTAAKDDCPVDLGHFTLGDLRAARAAMGDE